MVICSFLERLTQIEVGDELENLSFILVIHFNVYLLIIFLNRLINLEHFKAPPRKILPL